MQQLGALDNLMIGGELANLPMHMSAVMIYDTGGKRQADRLFDGFQRGFEKIVDRHFPILRCRVEELALQLDKSYWVKDPDFSLTYHVSRVALPRQRDWPALYRLFGQFHAQPLDRGRPLWQVMYVEGLDRLEGIPRGATALFLKIHHAVMDGKSALRLMSSFHSLDPEPGSPMLADSMPEEGTADADFRTPSLWVKYGRAWIHGIERPVELIGTLAKLMPQVFQAEESGTKASSQPTPQVRFNHPVAADRVVGHVRMDMGELRRLEKKFRCTINDIALCVVAGAMRNFLLGNDELPDENLQALMPIDVRRQDQDGHIGNHVSVAKVCLYTRIDDVKKRLLTISADSSRSKQQSRKSSSRHALELVDEIHPAIILSLGKWLINSGFIDALPQTVNTVVTNVPGIASDAYIEGSKLVDYLGFGPLAPNMGLFHTVSSTPDHVNISFLSTKEFINDGLAYRTSIAQAWQEISNL